MKKFTIIGFSVALIATILLLWQHFKRPSDDSLARQISGSWTRDLHKTQISSLADQVIYTNIFSSDGSFSYSFGHESALVTFQGILDGQKWRTCYDFHKLLWHRKSPSSFCSG